MHITAYACIVAIYYMNFLLRAVRFTTYLPFQIKNRQRCCIMSRYFVRTDLGSAFGSQTRILVIL